MEIYGYSERGIINSLIFAIGDKVHLMTAFIESMNIPEPFKLGEPSDYDVLLEQSFSRFGSADLVIIIKYDKPQNNKVLFIEGKVKTSQSAYWNLEKQYLEFLEKNKKKSSNLFFQLHLKKFLIESKDNIDDVKEFEKPKVVTENWYGTERNIGENKIVKRAYSMIKDCDSYYIGIIPSSVEDIANFAKFKKSDTDPIINYLHFVSWHTVKDFSELEKHSIKFKNVKLNFDYNEKQIFNEL